MGLGYHVSVINSGLVPRGFDQTVFATADEWHIIEIDGMIWWRPSVARLGIVGSPSNDPVVGIGQFPFGAPVQNIHNNMELVNYFYIAEPTIMSPSAQFHNGTLDNVFEWWGIKLHWRGLVRVTAETEWVISMGFPADSQSGYWSGHVRIGNS